MSESGGFIEIWRITQGRLADQYRVYAYMTKGVQLFEPVGVYPLLFVARRLSVPRARQMLLADHQNTLCQPIVAGEFVERIDL